MRVDLAETIPWDSTGPSKPLDLIVVTARIVRTMDAWGVDRESVAWSVGQAGDELTIHCRGIA